MATGTGQEASWVDGSQEESSDTSSIYCSHFSMRSWLLAQGIASSCCHLQYPGSLATVGNDYWEWSIKWTQGLSGTGLATPEVHRNWWELEDVINLNLRWWENLQCGLVVCPKICISVVDMVSVLVVPWGYFMMLTVYCWLVYFKLNFRQFTLFLWIS